MGLSEIWVLVALFVGGQIFGFEEQKYFDIKGKATGLFSQAMIAPDRAIRIPLNESQDDFSQIAEYLKEYKGEGIQHLAFATNDIFRTVDALRAHDTRWGYNCKRGNCPDISQDVVAYHAGAGPEVNGALETYTVDVISNH